MPSNAREWIGVIIALSLIAVAISASICDLNPYWSIGGALSAVAILCKAYEIGDPFAQQVLGLLALLFGFQGFINTGFGQEIERTQYAIDAYERLADLEKLDMIRAGDDTLRPPRELLLKAMATCLVAARLPSETFMRDAVNVAKRSELAIIDAGGILKDAVTTKGRTSCCRRSEPCRQAIGEIEHGYPGYLY